MRLCCLWGTSDLLDARRVVYLLFLVIVPSFFTHLQIASESLLEVRKQVTLAMQIQMRDVDIRTIVFEAAMAPHGSGSSKLSREERQRLANEKWAAMMVSGRKICCVCGYTEPKSRPVKHYNEVTAVHLVPSEEVYAMPALRMENHDPINNVIPLCDTKHDDVGPNEQGYRGKKSCHSMFTHNQMSFAHDPSASHDDREKWEVVGGGSVHGTKVTLITKPHRCVMYAHLKSCVGTRTLEIPDKDKIADVTTWLEGIHCRRPVRAY